MKNILLFIALLSSLFIATSCGTPSTRGFSGECREAERTISREEEVSATSMECEGQNVVLNYQNERRTLELKFFRNIAGGFGVEEGKPTLSLEYVAAKKEDEQIASKLGRFDFTWGFNHELTIQRRRIYLPPKLPGVSRWYDEYLVLGVKKKPTPSDNKCFQWVLNQNAVMRLAEDKKTLIDHWKALDPRKGLRCNEDKLCWKLDWLTSVSKAPINLKVCAGDRGRDPLTIMSVKHPKSES